jgi:peptide deformylase
MSLMNLVLYPDAPLLDKAEDITEFGPKLEKTAKDMLQTMYAYEGVGLAGPQVGLQKRIFVMHEPDAEPLCLINPEIVDLDGEQLGEEGCLSLPEVYAPVKRAQRLKVRALDPRGRKMEWTAEDLAARIILHENDHLDGVCFVDRLDIITRQDKLSEWQEIRERLVSPSGSRAQSR